MDYYRLKDDLPSFPDQWFITEIEGFENPLVQDYPESLLNQGHERWAHHATIKYGEIPLDYMQSFYGFCIVSDKVKTIFEANNIADVMYIPLKFDKKSATQHYFMLDTARLDCLDEVHSEFSVRTADDPIRPDLVGWYDSVFKFIVDPKKIHGQNIFRLTKLYSRIVVSQKIKDLFEAHGVIGARFEKATL